MVHDNHQDSANHDRTIVEEAHHHEDIPIDPVTQLSQPDDVDITLRRSSRVKKPAISLDYIVYLQESDMDIGAENDPITFSQAISGNKSVLWYDAMKDELKQCMGSC